jgi:hypothetical protein
MTYFISSVLYFLTCHKTNFLAGAEAKKSITTGVPIIPPTQLVDCSYPAYKQERSVLLNPTNAVGGLFIPGLPLRFELHSG